MTSEERPGSTENNLDAILDEFCEAWFAGENPDPDRFCREHSRCGPELRQRIESFLVAASHFAGTGEKRDGSSPLREESADDETILGRTLGDYRIIREIGRGGMARVFEAEQISLNRRVALKVLSAHLSFSKQAVRKFQREAEAGGRQSHPAIVATFGVGKYRGSHYIAQELVEGGETLADRLDELRRGGDLEKGYFRRAAELIARIAGALSYAHTSGVIHRDLKPSNILLSAEGEPKVSDFGLARVEGAEALSQSGDFAGTPYYMSPEQARSSRSAIDSRTDVYSLGVTLYETLSLLRPFDGDTSHDVIKKILLNEPRDPRKINPRVPPDLAVICLKAMEKDPGQRYQTMDELAEDLDRYLHGEPILARPSGSVSRLFKRVRRHKFVSLAAGTVLVALAAVAVLALVVFFQQEKRRDIARNNFRSIQECLGWSDTYYHRRAGEWCSNSAPDAPDSYIMKGVLHFFRGTYEQAIAELDLSIEKCRERDRPHLAKDAAFLMAVTKYRLSQRSDQAFRKQELIDEAMSVLPSDDDFDCTSPDVLVWRALDRSPSGDSEDDVLLRQVRLNQEHYLIHLYRGLLVFDFLFKGAERLTYDEAIQNLRRVLDEQPDNVVALTYLGRIYYFLARFYNLINLTEDAISLLDRARANSGDEPYHMIDTTLGQIHVLLGENEKAVRHFEKAIGLARGCSHIHNSIRGVAKVHARRGDDESAIESFEEALSGKPFDYHNNIAAAEFYRSRGKLEEALEHALQATSNYSENVMLKIRSESDLAPAYLICARLYLAKGEHEKVFEYLDKIHTTPFISPRDLSHACFLIFSIVDDTATTPGNRAIMVQLARRMAESAANNAHYEDHRSPISLAAMGVSHFLNEEFADAVDSLNKALELRAEWPAETRGYYWADDARDCYLLALAHHSAGRKEPVGREKNMELARDCFERAEELWEGNVLPYEYADIFEMVRNRVRNVLEGTFK